MPETSLDIEQLGKVLPELRAFDVDQHQFTQAYNFCRDTKLRRAFRVVGGCFKSYKEVVCVDSLLTGIFQDLKGMMDALWIYQNGFVKTE